MSVPEGWKLVPIEPTQEMKDAPNTVVSAYAARLVWLRMIEASPPPPKSGVR